MTDKQQSDALELASVAESADLAGYPTAKKANAYCLCLLEDCAQMIRRLHAENETLRSGYAAAPQPSPTAQADPDGEAFRTAARLGLTLRFYGGCAQSSMPGTPSAYEVVTGSDRAAAMREAVERAGAVIASGGESKRLGDAAQAAESVPALQGETNAQLDTDSNPTAPGQQRDVASSLALGQPVGNGSDQVAGHPSAQGNKLLTVAERNIRSFLRSATFKSESDREAVLNCVEVLWEITRTPADSVLEDAERYRWLRERSSTMFVNISINGEGAEIAATLDSAVDAARKQGANHD